MSHCHALKKNNTRCRAFASIESCSDDIITYKHTCKVHATYFDTFTFTKELVESLEFWPGISQFFKEAFELELVCVKEEFVAGLANHSKYSYFYLLAARFSQGFKPWNQPLYKKTFRLMWIWMGRIGPVQITYADLLDLAAIDPVPGFYMLIYSRGSREISWRTAAELCAKETWFEAVYHADADTHKTAHTLTQSNEFIHLPAFEAEYEWLIEAKEIYYANICARIPYKEELVARAWEPERVLAWCVDWEDKSRIAQNLKGAFA